MTDSQMWARVGEILAEARRTRGFASPWQLFDALHKPAVDTIRKIEEGRPGTVSSISEYADVLGLTLPSVLLSALANSESARLPSEVQAVVDALLLDDTRHRAIASWKQATKDSAIVMLELASQSQTRTPSGGPPNETSRAVNGRRGRRGTRQK